MLLSDEATAKFIGENFVPTWSEVRPVPKVTIELGDGKVVRRTLTGNTVLYVSLSDGTVVDAFPGVYTPEDFRDLAEQALEVARKAEALPTTEREHFLRQWHEGQIMNLASAERARTSMSKMFVESPILDAIGLDSRDPDPVPSQGILGARFVQSDARITAEADSISRNPSAVSKFRAYAARIEDMSKRKASAGSLRNRHGIAKEATPEQAAQVALLADSRTNVQRVHPAVHFLLIEEGPRTAEALKERLYKELLHIPIDDPYLGLRDVAMPGTTELDSTGKQ